MSSRNIIFIEIAGAYLNKYVFSNLSNNPIWSIILNYLEYFSKTWGDKHMTKIGIRDLAKILYENDKSLEPYFQTNMFKHYIELKGSIIVNTEQGINWFESLNKDIQIKFFEEYDLERIANIFHISQKNHNSFIKALNNVNIISERPPELINWYKKMKELRAKNVIIKNPNSYEKTKEYNIPFVIFG